MLNLKHVQPSRRHWTLAILVFLSLLITIASAWFVRYQNAVIGNLCPKTQDNLDGLCFDMLPTAGFPFSYWRDIGGISVERTLGPEDELLVTHFAVDWLIWFLMLAIVTVLIKTVQNARHR